MRPAITGWWHIPLYIPALPLYLRFNRATPFCGTAYNTRLLPHAGLPANACVDVSNQFCAVFPYRCRQNTGLEHNLVRRKSYALVRGLFTGRASCLALNMPALLVAR